MIEASEGKYDLIDYFVDEGQQRHHGVPLVMW